MSTNSIELLRNYLNAMRKPEQAAFATRCGTSLGYLRKAIAVGQIPGPHLCVQLEIASDGELSRERMRPDDYPQLWPEIVRRKPVTTKSRGRGKGAV